MEQRKKYPESAMSRHPLGPNKGKFPRRQEESMKCVYAGPDYFKKKMEEKKDADPDKKDVNPDKKTDVGLRRKNTSGSGESYDV